MARQGGLHVPSLVVQIVVIFAVAVAGTMAGHQLAVKQFAPAPQSVADAGLTWQDADQFITLSELENMIASKREFYAYFWDPECPYCKQADQIIIPMSVKDLFILNIIQHPQAWDTYNVEGTPTIAHFRDGQEQGRLVGVQSEDTYRAFFQIP